MNAFERRQEERKVKQRRRSNYQNIIASGKRHHLMTRYEVLCEMISGKSVEVNYHNGRYYVDNRSYQEQALLHKIREMEASLHERELVNEV